MLIMWQKIDDTWLIEKLHNYPLWKNTFGKHLKDSSGYSFIKKVHDGWTYHGKYYDSIELNPLIYSIDHPIRNIL